MKIKSKPEDFIVDEIAPMDLSDRGQYAFFRLRKSGFNTANAVKIVAKELRVTLDSISYCGNKDRHARTSQLISIENFSLPENIEWESLSLEFLGYSNRPAGPDLIQGNQFKITVRDLEVEQVKQAMGEIEEVKKTGLPNYFDDQRFRSYDLKQGFLAEKLIKKEFNGALKVYLTRELLDDTGPAKQRKQFFFSNWKNWAACLEQAQTVQEKDFFSYLVNNEKDFLGLLQRISHEEMSDYFKSYQSFLWNETVRRFLKREVHSVGLKTYPGKTGEYLFYQTLTPDHLDQLKELNLGLPASRMDFSYQILEEILINLLTERKQRTAMFNLREIRQAYFKSYSRQLLLFIDKIDAQISQDDLFPAKTKLILDFILPRGSYATLLVKRLFSFSLIQI